MRFTLKRDLHENAALGSKKVRSLDFASNLVAIRIHGLVTSGRHFRHFQRSKCISSSKSPETCGVSNKGGITGERLPKDGEPEPRFVGGLVVGSHPVPLAVVVVDVLGALEHLQPGRRCKLWRWRLWFLFGPQLHHWRRRGGHFFFHDRFWSLWAKNWFDWITNQCLFCWRRMVLLCLGVRVVLLQVLAGVLLLLLHLVLNVRPKKSPRLSDPVDIRDRLNRIVDPIRPNF